METWVAYTVPRSLNIDPTLENLNKMEEEELKKSMDVSVEMVADAASSMQINAPTNQELLYPFL